MVILYLKSDMNKHIIIMDAIEVKPRYLEPIVTATGNNAHGSDQNTQQAVISPIGAEPQSMTRGLFTSMYENKIIVLIIVIVIILISIIAYIFCRNPDVAKEQKTIEPMQSGKQPTQTVKSAENSNIQPTESTVASSDSGDDSNGDDTPKKAPLEKTKPDAKKLDNTDLMELYNRSKNITTTTVEKSPVVYADSKTNDEILELMEDEEYDDQNDQNATYKDEEKAKYDL